MTPQYRVEPTARSDLASISDFIANDSVSAAERMLDRFHETFRFLAQNPQSGERRAGPWFGPATIHARTLCRSIPSA
jgi:plasmid stabilization system protein ParE